MFTRSSEGRALLRSSQAKYGICAGGCASFCAVRVGGISGSPSGSGHGSAEHLGHKCALCGVIGRSIITELQSEGPLQICVGLRLVWVGAEIISERQMLLKCLASRRANIEVMWKIVNGRTESLTPGDAEITSMRISECRETVDSRRKISFSCQKHIDIDDGFSCEIRHGRASYMLDCSRHAVECFGNSLPEELKAFEPTRVVIHDNNRICHSSFIAVVRGRG